MFLYDFLNVKSFENYNNLIIEISGNDRYRSGYFTKSSSVCTTPKEQDMHENNFRIFCFYLIPLFNIRILGVALVN